MRPQSLHIVRVAAAWGTAITLGCAPAAAPPPAAAPKALPSLAAAPAPTKGAIDKFADFSKELEKLGTDDVVDPERLKQKLGDIVAADPTFLPARFDIIMIEDHQDPGPKTHDALAALAKQDASFAPATENLAADAVAAGDIDQAVAVYRKIIEAHPKDQTSRLALARIESTQKNYQDAINLARQVLQRQADAMEAFRVLAISYNALGNTPMAELIIGRGLKVNRNDVELHNLLAQIFLARDDLPNGVAKLKQVVRMDPQRLSARAQLAGIALSYRDFGNAVQQYEAILKAKPDQPAVQLDLAVSYKGLGRYEDAEKLYKQVLAQDPKNADALWDVGVLYHRHLNKYDEAIDSLQRFKAAARTDDDKVGQVDGLLAEIMKLKNDQAATQAREEHERKKREAVDTACAAVEAGKPVNASAIGNDQERIEIAWQIMANAQTAIQGGDVPTGERAVHCAFAIVPTSPAANTGACAPMHVMWTQILYQLNRPADAAVTIKEALKCDPNNPDAQLIQQQLLDIMKKQGDAATPAPAAAPAPAPAPAPTKAKGSRKK